MGQNNEISAQGRQLIEKLKFIQKEESVHYGQLLVYRVTQKPFDYYLRYRQIYQNSPQSQQIIKQNKEIYSAVEGQRNIVKVEVISTEKAQSLCSDGVTVDCYAKYFNYTLENAIQNKKKTKKMFRDEDLLYVFNSMVDVGIRVAEKCSNFYFGLFKTTRIFLSTQGFIKIYPFKINQQGGMGQLNLSDTSSDSHQGNRHSHYKGTSNDLRDIALVIAQLSLIEQKQNLQTLSKEHICFKLDKGLSGKISPRIRHLTIRLLEGENISWINLKKELQNICNIQNMRPSFCLRLEEDISLRESEIMEKQHDQFNFNKVQRSQRQLALSTLQPHLVASRIEPLSRGRRL